MTEERIATCGDRAEAWGVVEELRESFVRMGLGKSHGARAIQKPRLGVWWVMVTRDKESGDR